jgi:hypothetical protein
MAAAYGKMLSLTAGPAIPGAWRQWLALAVANGTTGSVKEIACGGLTGGRTGKFTPSCRFVLKKQFRNSLILTMLGRDGKKVQKKRETWFAGGCTAYIVCVAIEAH